MKKNNMIRSLKYFAFILLLAIIASCSDKYVDVKPVGALNSSSFYTTMTEADEAVTAAYSALMSITWDRDAILTFGDVPSDDAEAGGNYENEVPDIEVFNRFTQDPSNSHLLDMYGFLFRGVYFSNLAMENIPQVATLYPDKADTIKERMAELKFVRALNYMYLMNIFGQVPLVDHVLGPSEYSQPKASFKDLFDFVEKDLTEAIPVLPSISVYKKQKNQPNIGRATKGAAQALLARAYLFESSYAKYYPGDSRFTGLTEHWQDVLDLCEQVINSGEYKLVGIDGETYDTWRGPKTNGIQYIFTVEGDNSPESVFAIQYINDGGGYVTARAGSLVQWISARYYTDPSTGAQQPTSYWGLGWPTQSLVDMYDTGDARLKAYISRPADPSINWPGDSIQVSGGKWYPVNYDNTATGYYDKKYECSAAQFVDAPGSTWDRSPYNVKLIRYSDVVLMAAEAALMLNQNSKALMYVNMVRKRARMCGNSGQPADLTGPLTFKQLVDERRRELALEGRRFFDLVRWNLAKDVLPGTFTPGGVAIAFESPKDDFQPLPQQEISLSQGALVQYPGW